MNAKKFIKSITPPASEEKPGQINIYQVVCGLINPKAKLDAEQQEGVQHALQYAQICAHSDGSHWEPIQAGLQIATFINTCK